MLLDLFPKYDIEMMFGDDKEAIKNFGEFLIKMEEQNSLDEDDILLSGNNLYEDKIEKIRDTPVKNINDLILKLHKINKITKKMKKNTKYASSRRSRDLSIASYLNDKRYKKKFLDKKKYRKHMKNIAKAESKELKEMKKLGYIKSNDPDEKLNKLKLDKINEQMLNALSDAYTQKHFI